MYRGTTPTFVFKVSEDIELESMKEIWVTFKSFTTALTKELSDLAIDDEEKTITVKLSQSETLSFAAGSVDVQIRFLDNTDSAYASPIKKVDIKKILKEGVIE